jgi:hypothetical protein
LPLNYLNYKKCPSTKKKSELSVELNPYLIANKNLSGRKISVLSLAKKINNLLSVF